MPALDTLLDNNKARHIADRNRSIPTTTLCGQPLENSYFFFFQENFNEVTCKTCRKLYFGEAT
jgi:hypothetical protein